MEYVKLGRTGLEVSRLCLGCMSFGDPARGMHTWTLPEAESRVIIRRAVELGVNFFDTANVYSDGTSEEIVGRALAEFARRDEIVIATKVQGRVREGPNGAGLSRKAILAELDASLGRLGTDYVDLYQIHRWDGTTPIEETLQALHDVVRAGKVRYIGASSMSAWQFASALYKADLAHLTRFVSMQDHYNLLYRESEREMFPLCQAEGIGVLAWSPLARGRLTRPNDAISERQRTDTYARSLYGTGLSEGDRQIIEAVHAVAKTRGVSAAQVATAWVCGKPFVTAPIIGATRLAHLEEAAAALPISLTDDELALLEGPYAPRPVMDM